MFCPKCGKKAKDGVAFCPECGGRMNAMTFRVRIIRACISEAALLVFFFGTYAASEWFNQSESVDEMLLVAGTIFAAGAVFLGFFILLMLFIQGVKLLARFLAPRPAVTAISLLLVFVGSGAGIWFMIAATEQEYREAEKALPVLQDMLTEADIGRAYGDVMLPTKPKQEMTDELTKGFKEIGETMRAYEVPDMLKDYRAAVADWTMSASTATKTLDDWKNLPESPKRFKIAMSERWSKIFFARSVDQILELKEFGDRAIRRNDRETMLYISAKLLVQKHWLDGLSQAETKLFGYAIQPAYAAETATSPNNICFERDGKTTCLDDVLPMVNDLYKSSKDFAFGGKDAAKTWETNWETTKPVMTVIADTAHELEAYAAVIVTDAPPKPKKPSAPIPQPVPPPAAPEGSTGGTTEPSAPAGSEIAGQKPVAVPAGITQGQPDPVSNATAAKRDAVQAFFEECHGKGGIVGGTGSVTRIPTSESGYTCQYRDGTDPCWDLLTYSGSRYLGGNPGCPEYRLLPVNILPESKKAQAEAEATTLNSTAGPTAATDISPPPPEGWTSTEPDTQAGDTWDGTYQVNQSASCSGDASAQLSQSGTFTVKNNVMIVGNLRGPISGGMATLSSTETRMYEGMRNVITGTITWSFTRSGNQVNAREWGFATTVATNPENGDVYFMYCDNTGGGTRISK
ncbi:MAG: zinc-ribbon domain-containing protein [Patescibacteria group bacterium]